MSLYGLDIIEDQNSRRHLVEINGIRSGMRGFSKVYGDDRVQKRVNHMLQERYGKLTVNDGTFSRKQFIKRHPIKFLYGYSLSRVPGLNQLLFPLPQVLHSPQAEIDWMKENYIKEKTQNGKSGLEHFDIYEKYDGTESTIINLFNEQLPHPLVNNFVAEEITRDKFLQYVLLRESEISENLIPSTFVGLGITHKGGLIGLMGHEKFVRKPILGMQGRGVRFLNRNLVMALYDPDGPKIQYVDRNIFGKELGKKNGRPEYLEDMIDAGNFAFELGISIVQPFLESRRTNEEFYSSIRAVVCNGKFVDAYKRVSTNPRVNLSQDAEAVEFNFDSSFAEFCENVVRVFEEKSSEQNPNSFRKDLYQRYMESMGRKIPRWKSDLEKNILNHLLNAMIDYSQMQERK